MARVVLHRDHVRIQGNPHRLRADEIEYLVRVTPPRACARLAEEPAGVVDEAAIVTPPRACARLQSLTVTSLSPERATLSR